LRARQEEEPAPNFIDMNNIPDQPIATRDLVLQCTRRCIVQIEMAPAITLREPEELVGRFEDPQIGQAGDGVVEIDETRRALAQDVAYPAGSGVELV